ncbi:MAG: (4Fe-4S)-binding protein [Solirubrobacterales bacterium]|nr:(4Fe-4S)-binding protein [Solirubrobacterales bacterium]
MIADNRGTCAHSGFCSDRLPTVFRTDEEPFVAPAGGRVDEILRAARDCPSGALAAATGDTDPVGKSDSERKPAIEVSKEGPAGHPRGDGPAHQAWGRGRCAGARRIGMELRSAASCVRHPARRDPECLPPNGQGLQRRPTDRAHVARHGPAGRTCPPHRPRDPRRRLLPDVSADGRRPRP